MAAFRGAICKVLQLSFCKGCASLFVLLIVVKKQIDSFDFCGRGVYCASHQNGSRITLVMLGMVRCFWI